MNRNIYPICLGTMVALLLSISLANAQSFYNQLPVPDTVDRATVNLSVDQEVHNFDPGGTGYLNTDVTTFAYNYSGSGGNTYLGPTIIWRKGREQFTNVTNNLTTSATTVHWHGAHIPPRMDGGPHQPIKGNGGLWPIHFDILEDPATLWYHPHLDERTFTQVEMGLSGIIIIEDDTNTTSQLLPHTYNIDDFPIILQDKKFDTTGGTVKVDTAKGGRNTLVVNGVVNAYLEVPAQMVRFRVLDGSSRISFHIGVGKSETDLETIQLVAADGGYLEEVKSTTSFLTGPGIRNEFVVDFTGMQDSVRYLINAKSQMPSGVVGPPNSISTQLLELRIVAPTANPITSIPIQQSEPDSFHVADASRFRTKRLQGKNGGGSATQSSDPYNIDGNQFLLTVLNDTVLLDATEIWTIENTSDIAHPFHIHDIYFYVLDVRDTNNVLLPYPDDYIGPQDNIMVLPGHKARFITKFADFGSAIDYNYAYMYHCHILTHEDGYYLTQHPRDSAGMMQQFVVWDGTVAETGEQELVEGLVIYPNPARDLINLKGTSEKASSLCIHDLQGKAVLQKELPPFEGTGPFDVSMLSPGMYLVEWRSERGSFTKKVVID